MTKFTYKSVWLLEKVCIDLQQLMFMAYFYLENTPTFQYPFYTSGHVSSLTGNHIFVGAVQLPV